MGAYVFDYDCGKIQEPPLKEKKIFIVEDSVLVSLGLQNMLEGLGYTVVGSASTGEQAVGDCIKARPDLVLMDVKLPGELTGIEASREIRSKIDVPVIYTTAYSDRDTIEEAQKSFPFGFVIKPYREKDLLVAIETAFTRYRYEQKLLESEQKYKSLFDGTKDIIFTMDDTWNILTVNWAVMNYLNIPPHEIIMKKFLDLVFEPLKENFKTKSFIQEKLDYFLKARRPLNFKTSFKSKYNDEPVELSVRLESINVPYGNLIMGRASRIADDVLLKFFISEKQKLVMGNQLFLVSEVAYRITRNLKLYLDSDMAEFVRLSLVEIIINAIEHGNLEVSYQEKSEVLRVENYFEYITRRQSNPLYRNRNVTIEFDITPEKAEYTISDDGRGFDHESFFNNEIAGINADLKPHGRGLYMSQKIFDEIRFNKAGNMVTLVKKFNGR